MSGGSGGSPSEETIKKISERKKGVPFSNEHIKSLSEGALKRKPTTEETKKNMSRAQIGNKNSSGHKNVLGYKWTEEQRKNQSKSQKKRPPTTEETKKNMSKAQMGKKRAQKAIQKGIKTKARNKALKEQLKQHQIQSIIFRQHYLIHINK